MKNFLFFLVFLAQAPLLLGQEGMRHQGVLRDNGTLVQSQNIGVQYLIRQGDPAGTMVYNETASLQTNQFGQFSHTVGSLNPGTFATVDWSQGDFFLEVIVNGTNMGVTEITKVPLAYYADRAAQADQVADLSNRPLGELSDVQAASPDTSDLLFYNGSNWEAGSPRDRLPIAWGWVQTGTLNYEGTGIASITSPNTGEYQITLTESVSGFPCIIATGFTRFGNAEIMGYAANFGSNVITIKVYDAANPGTLKNSDFSFVVYDN